MALNSLTIAQQGLQNTPYLIAVQGLGDVATATAAGGPTKKRFTYIPPPDDHMDRYMLLILVNE